MLTVCVPIYNVDVNQLVDSLIDQLKVSEIPFQILCFDDKSDEKYRLLNKDLGLKFNVNYTELDENIGRARIRNKMARLARYDFMLFLDCDSVISRSNFIAQYVELIYNQHIVHGGRIYRKESPTKEYRLHWLYGTKVESKSLNKRIKDPVATFMSNNFMVTAKVMKEHPFDESITGYGYEDTEWAERVTAHGYFIHNIENPVLHDVLDENPNFIAKTERSIDNLIALLNNGKLKPTKLSRTVSVLRKFGFDKFVRFISSYRMNSLRSKLEEGRGGVISLQMYKLVLFLQKSS